MTRACPRCGFDPGMPEVANDPPVRLASGLYAPAWSLTAGGVLVQQHVHDELASDIPVWGDSASAFTQQVQQVPPPTLDDIRRSLDAVRASSFIPTLPTFSIPMPQYSKVYG
jgi:hypothetical protein